MDDTDIEKTISDLNSCITNPEDRMSEAAICLMTKLMAKTIRTMEEVTMEALTQGAVKSGKGR